MSTGECTGLESNERVSKCQCICMFANCKGVVGIVGGVQGYDAEVRKDDFDVLDRVVHGLLDSEQLLHEIEQACRVHIDQLEESVNLDFM